MALQLLVEAVTLLGPDCLHRLPRSRHVPGEEEGAEITTLHYAFHVLQAENKALTLRRQSTQQIYKIGKTRHTDRTTRLLIVILVLFLVAEFPLVSLLSYLARPYFSAAGSSWSSFCCLGQRVLPRLLQSIGGDHGHNDLDQQLSQLHPLLPNVLTVQDHTQEDCLYEYFRNIFSTQEMQPLNNKDRGNKIKRKE